MSGLNQTKVLLKTRFSFPIFSVEFGTERDETDNCLFLFLIHHIQVITTNISTPPGGPSDKILSSVYDGVGRVFIWKCQGNLSQSASLWQRKQSGEKKLTGWVVPEKMYSYGALRCMRFLANRKEGAGKHLQQNLAVYRVGALRWPQTQRERPAALSSLDLQNWEMCF